MISRLTRLFGRRFSAMGSTPSAEVVPISGGGGTRATATGGLTTAPMTASGAATFSGGVHTASGALTDGPMTASGSATFRSGTFTGTAALVDHPMIASGSATSSPLFTGTGSLVNQHMTATGSATFSPPVYHGTGSFTTQHMIMAGSAIFAGHQATGVLISPPMTCLGTATFVPSGITPVSMYGPGWYASDFGLILSYAGPHAFYQGEKRGVFMDFAPLAEIVAGDALTGTPVTMFSPPSLTCTAPIISGTRAEVTISGFAENLVGHYDLIFQVATADGSTFVRRGLVRVESIGTVVWESAAINTNTLITAGGWSAADDAFIVAAGGIPQRQGPLEARRYFMDFSTLTEIQNGDTILDENSRNPPAIGSSPAGLVFANLHVDVSANKVYADISGGTVNTDYLAVYKVNLAGGATVIRGGKVRCANT